MEILLLFSIMKYMTEAQIRGANNM